jgi:hypothetical protein
MARHRLNNNHRRLGLSKMRAGGWGRVQVAVRRAFLARPGPLTTTQIGQWAYARAGELKAWQRGHIIAVTSKLARRVGRLNPGGILWKPKP